MLLIVYKYKFLAYHDTLFLFMIILNYFYIHFTLHASLLTLLSQLHWLVTLLKGVYYTLYCFKWINFVFRKFLFPDLWIYTDQWCTTTKKPQKWFYNNFSSVVEFKYWREVYVFFFQFWTVNTQEVVAGLIFVRYDGGIWYRLILILS